MAKQQECHISWVVVEEKLLWMHLFNLSSLPSTLNDK